MISYCLTILSLIFLTFTAELIPNDASRDEKKIVIVTASYKNVEQVDTYFNSILNQSHKNYKIIYVADDDCTPHTDGTGVVAEEFVKKNGLGDRVTIVRNHHRQYALQNVYKAVLSCDDEDIIALVDGDDALAGPEVLAKINTMYLNPTREIWATYGNFKSLLSDKPCSWIQQIPPEVIMSNSMRKWNNGPAHLRTFKAWVFKNIKIEDFFYEGSFFKTAYDVALLEPLYEMIGDKYDWTQEVLYLYNDLDVVNHPRNRTHQLHLDRVIRQKASYPRLMLSESGRIERLKQEGLLKAAVIVFLESHASLENIYAALASNIQNIDQILVITPEPRCSSKIYGTSQARDASSLIKTYSIKELPNIINTLQAEYVLCLDAVEILQKIALNHALSWLEKTHAHACYCALDKNTWSERSDVQDIALIQVSLEDTGPDTLYAWQYQGISLPGLTTLAALVRIKDVQFISDFKEIETVEQLNKLWNDHLNKDHVGLFYRGDVSFISQTPGG